ncbi:MAG: ATPase domain-containing protein, partial [Ideonella sp.]
MIDSSKARSDATPALAIVAAAFAKAPTGIVGFDAISGGGLPQGRTTLIVGGPGSGKTI